MKKRVISAFVAFLIVIPLLIIGGYAYKLGVITLGVIALFEIIKAKSNKKNIPLLVKIMVMFTFILTMLVNINNNFVLNIDYKYLILNALLLFLPLVIYNDDKKYGIEDAAYLFTFSTFLVLGFNALMMIREYNVYYLMFLLVVTITSDTFAFFVGKLIGKHKMCPSISPNKTIEGFLGGLLFSTFITTSIYYVTFEYTGNIILLILFVMLLSVVSTLGDLFFSYIKRHYDIKDFGNIMPGHGGILDRVDSLLFVLLTFCLIVSII